MRESTTESQKTSIYLYGPSGSGKSTVGKILADKLNMEFEDLDLEIEAQSGMSIPEIFSMEGEPGFRAREHQALQAATTSRDKVIALGGGALTIPRNRELAETKGQVLLLNAPPETLLARLRDDVIERPLLSPSQPAAPTKAADRAEAMIASEDKLRALLVQRQAHYASFSTQIATDGQSPEAIAWEIQVILGRFHLRGMASTKHPGYDVRVQSDGLDVLGDLMRARGLHGTVAVVTDENVGRFYLPRVTAGLTQAGFEASSVTIPAGEKHKTLETVSKLWAAFAAANIERGSTIIALGGGVVGDLAGFAAASWLRGVAWVAVPTSLLAMVDASMGGKTGFDLPQGKNLVGSFHPPRLVLADPDVLQTLPEFERVNGMAEVIKHGVIADPGLFELCGTLTGLEEPEELVSRAMAVKVKIIEEDPYEKGIRAALNLGHTVGHGVELASGFKLGHGEAVAIGMVSEARMSEQIGLAETGLADKISAVLQTAGLPTEIPPNLDRNQIAAAMTRDKKKAGGIIKFALPAAIGDVRVGVTIDDWRKMIGV